MKAEHSKGTSNLSPVFCMALLLFLLVFVYIFYIGGFLFLWFLETILFGTEWITLTLLIFCLIFPLYLLLLRIAVISRALMRSSGSVQLRLIFRNTLGSNWDTTLLGAQIGVASRRHLKMPAVRDLLARRGQAVAKRAASKKIQSHDNSTSFDEVEISAFAPRTYTPGGVFLVQALVHMPKDHAVAEALAAAADPATTRRAVNTLAVHIARGERLDIDLDVAECAIDEPRQTVKWNGEPEAIQFFVSVPYRCVAPLPVRVTVARAGVPIGALKFMMIIASGRQDQPIEMRGDHAKQFSRAFLSYASSDRVRVLSSAQLLQLAGIEVFQDVLSLEPGERWEKRLFVEIDNCDLFLLFWSDAARRSKWVVKEVKYALDRHTRNNGMHPDIKPVILEGPPVPKPPRSLRAIHFNDRFRFFIAAAELDTAAATERANHA